MSWVRAGAASLRLGALQRGRTAVARPVNKRGLAQPAGKKKNSRGPWRRRKGGETLPPPPSRNLNEDVELTAQVERVTFHNSENGYSVVRASVEGEPADVTLCGTMHGVREGQLFAVSGRWGQHPQYGEQLAVTACAPVAIEALASSAAGLVTFLAKTGATLRRFYRPILWCRAFLRTKTATKNRHSQWRRPQNRRGHRQSFRSGTHA